MTLKSVLVRANSMRKKKFKLGAVPYVIVSQKPFDKIVKTKFYRNLYMRYIKNVYKKVHTPVRVDIEATNICNADCVFCPRSSHTRKQKIMEMDLFKKIVDDLAKIETLSEVCLSGFGEPLIDRNLPEKIKYAKSKNPNWTTIIFSNGTFLTEETANKILDSGLDRINFSFNGGTKEVYEKTMGTEFEKARDNIQKFIELRNQRGQKTPFVIVSNVLNKENLHDEIPFKNLWEGKADQIVVVKPHDWVGNIDPSIINIGAPKFAATFPCRLVLHPFINWDGIVSLCCHDYNEFTKFGDLNTHSFQDIWNSEKYANFRQSNVDGKLQSICATCEVPYTESSTSWLRPF